MESREHRRTIGAQENTEFTIPDTVCVLGVLVLCGIHLSYSIAHQEQSGASWLKQTANAFYGCNSRRRSHIFGNVLLGGLLSRYLRA